MHLLTRSSLTKLIKTLVTVFVLGAATQSNAVPIVVPPGLNPGDQYRLAFVTSTTGDATSLTIGPYNAFVTAVANSVPQLAALGTTWTVIGSTGNFNAVPQIDARDNTSTNPFLGTGFPIYTLSGSEVRANNADLWSGNSLLNPINITENGTVLNTTVWTGTGSSGVGLSGAQLGHPVGMTGVGNSSSVSQWISTGALQSNALPFSFYALSGTLTVVPEPGSATLLAMGLVAMVGVRRQQV